MLTLDADLQAAYAWPDSMRPALAPPSALQAPPALPRLHTLTISSIRGDLASDIGTIMANQAVASLTQMTLQHRHSFMHSVARSVPGVKPLIFFDSFIRRNSRVTPWEKAVAAAGQCHRLQCLRLQIPHSARGRASEPHCGEALASAVSRLPLLTYLRLDGSCQQCLPETSVTIPGEVFGRSLRALQRLQRLHIGGGVTCSVTEPAGVLGALPTLNCLTYLGLCCGGIDQSAVGEVIPKLHVLKELQVDAALFGGNGEATKDAFAACFLQVKITACAAG